MLGKGWKGSSRHKEGFWGAGVLKSFTPILPFGMTDAPEFFHPTTDKQKAGPAMKGRTPGKTFAYCKCSFPQPTPPPCFFAGWLEQEREHDRLYPHGYLATGC